MFIYWIGLCGILLATACHDAPRKNPFDPVRTPPVTLSASLDEAMGTTHLSWTPYFGIAPFQYYLVLRNAAESTRTDTLAQIATIDSTNFTDDTLAPNTAYQYRIAIVNDAGFHVPSNEQAITGFTLTAVQLLAAEPDPQTGQVHLRWSQYRSADFAAYRVERRISGTDATEVIAHITAKSDTTLADDAILADVEYVYQIIVEAAEKLLPSNSRETLLILPVVTLQTPVANSHNAAISLSWSIYTGPRFSAYRIERRSADQRFAEITRVPTIDTVSLIDTDLLGNTEYFYRVVIETTRGEAVASAEQSGKFHPLVSSWSLPLQETDQAVRLYWEDDRLVALVAGAGREAVRLLSFDAMGNQLDEQVLMDQWMIGGLVPKSVSTTRLQDGTRLLSAARFNDESGVEGLTNLLSLLHFDADGRMLRQRREMFPEVGQVLIGAAFRARLIHRERTSDPLIDSRLPLSIDRIDIVSGSDLIISEDFNETPSNIRLAIDNENNQNFRREFTGGRLFYENYGGSRTVFSFSDSNWTDLSTLIDFGSRWGIIAIDLGALTTRASDAVRLLMEVNTTNGNLEFLRSQRTIDDNGKFQSENEALTAPFPFDYVREVTYGYGLGTEGQNVKAWIENPLVWQHIPATASWGSLGLVRGQIVLSYGEQPRTLVPDLEAPIGIASQNDESPYAQAVSEMRTWTPAGDDSAWIGVCQPEANRILYDSSDLLDANRAIWPGALSRTQVIGQGVGSGPGQLIYPISFDVAPDGRFYILDAGNARIQVFDADGHYLTHWGSNGTAEGAFDFSGGNKLEDFVGSVAVDSEGFIYVADVGNGRIQKFAP